MLFHSFDVREALEQQAAKAKDAIERWPPDDLLGQPEEDVMAYVTDQFTVEAPDLHRGHAEVVDQREAIIDVSGRFEYGAFTRRRPCSRTRPTH